MSSSSFVALFLAFTQLASGLEIKTIMTQELVTSAPDIVASVVELNFPPGDQGIPPHYHSGPVVGYVIQGQFLLQMKGENARIVEAGSAFYEKDRDIHVWGANASNSTDCKVTVTVYGRPGEETLTFVQEPPKQTYQQALASALRHRSTRRH